VTSKTSYRVPAQVLVAHLEGEAVILHMDTKRYYRLNDTAAVIWKALERGESIPGIVAALRKEFDVAGDVATHEAERVVAELVELGLLTRQKDDRTS
jgi:hypothetical protein